MCSLFSSCWKRTKECDLDITDKSNNQVQNTNNTITINRAETNIKDYNLYIVQKNIQQLLDLQKIQMEYLKEIEKLHNKKDE